MRLSKYPVIFIQIPKTGTGSINDILLQTAGHRPASWLRQNNPEEEWNNRFKFAIIRHPFDRFVATRAHFKAECIAQMLYADPLSYSISEIILRPQSWYLDEPIDFIGDFYLFKREWEYIRKMGGIEETIGHKNKSKKKTPLTQSEKEFLLEYYKDDFERFGFNPFFEVSEEVSENNPVYG